MVSRPSPPPRRIRIPGASAEDRARAVGRERGLLSAFTPKPEPDDHRPEDHTP